MIEHTGLSAGDALIKMNNGAKISRSGWNGKGMYAVKIPAGNACYLGKSMQDCYGLVTPNGCIQAGWVFSTADMSANWCLRKARHAYSERDLATTRNYLALARYWLDDKKRS